MVQKKCQFDEQKLGKTIPDIMFKFLYQLSGVVEKIEFHANLYNSQVLQGYFLSLRVEKQTFLSVKFYALSAVAASKLLDAKCLKLL